MPTEKSLHAGRPAYSDRPACHARSPNGTYCTISPSLRIERMGRHPSNRHRSEKRMHLTRQAAGEEPIDPRPAKLRGGKLIP